MHARVLKLIVKDIKRRKFVVSRAECSLVRHGVFGRSECLAKKGNNLLGALSRSILSHEVKR